MSVLLKPVLVLNKYYNAIHVISVKRSIIKASIGLADIVDHRDFMRYTWDQWTKLPQDDQDEKIITPRITLRTPHVIVLKYYAGYKAQRVKLSRRNIFIRDHGVCQYTGKFLTMRHYTVDHVLPESRGGSSTWDNLVLCDPEINLKKGNRTPDEAGLRLLRKPITPTWSPLYKLGVIKEKIPGSWKSFLPNL